MDLSAMESQFRTAIRQKIIDAQAAPLPVLTPRDVWVPAGQQALIQVCSELDNPATLEREVRALQDAHATWPDASLQIVALEPPATANLPAEVRLHMAADWLLWQPGRS